MLSSTNERLSGKVENIVQLERLARPQVTLSIHSRPSETNRHYIQGFKKKGLKLLCQSKQCTFLIPYSPMKYFVPNTALKHVSIVRDH